MITFNKNQLDYIADQMRKVDQSRKQKNHKEIAIKFYNATVALLKEGLVHKATVSQIEENLIPISLIKLRNQSGRYVANDKKYYWSYWFQQNFPLFEISKLGWKNSKQGEYTMVRVLDETILLDDMSDTEYFEYWYKDLTETNFDICPVDIKSLENFIAHNRNIKPANIDHKTVLDKNYQDAKRILKIAKIADGNLPQIIKESEFGRKYYSGVNLQSVSKPVRKAALGKCYAYDISSSAICWKFDTVSVICKESDETFNPKREFSYTYEYITDKARIRKQMAQVLFDNQSDYSIKVVKDVFNAIGFGATASSAKWKTADGSFQSVALRDIVRDKARLDQLLNDKWMSQFITEQKLINNIIFSYLKNSIKDIDCLKNQNAQLSKNKSLAYLYQQYERKVLEDLINTINEDQPNNVILLCHDGFYTKNPIDLFKIRTKLKEWMPTANLDKEEITAFSKNLNHLILDEHEHKLFIQSQEKYAQEGYASLGRQFEQHTDYINYETELTEYDFESDPFYDDMDPTELAIIKARRNSTRPEFIRELL